MERNKRYFHTRPMIGAAAGAVLGVLCGILLPSFWWALGLLVVAAIVACFVRKRVTWMLLAVCFAVLCLRTALVPKDAVQTGEYRLVGTVAETPEVGKTTIHLTLKNVSMDGKPLRARVSLKCSVYVFHYGDTIEVQAAVKPVTEIQSMASGIFTSAETKDTPILLSQGGDWYGELLRLRASFAQAIDRMYGDMAPIAKGMLLGDRSDLDYTEQRQFADTGILHLFAVSGMHITVLLTLMGSLLRTGKRWLNLLLLLLVAALYSALTAFTPSVLRAAFFLLALELPSLSDRQSDAPSAFCFSLAAVLLLNPYSLFTASCLLSFGAMAGILLLTKPLSNLLHLPDNRFTRALLGSITAIIGILPLQASLFGSISWMSIPMSLLLAPVLPIMMPLAFISMFLSPFMPNAARILTIIPYGGLVYIERITSWLQTAPLRIQPPHFISVVLYYTGLIFCSQLYLTNHKHPPYIGFSVLAASIILWVVL